MKPRARRYARVQTFLEPRNWLISNQTAETKALMSRSAPLFGFHRVIHGPANMEALRAAGPPQRSRSANRQKARNHNWPVPMAQTDSYPARGKLRRPPLSTLRFSWSLIETSGNPPMVRRANCYFSRRDESSVQVTRPLDKGSLCPGPPRDRYSYRLLCVYDDLKQGGCVTLSPL